ncbi:MAG: Eco57I restriction-modification methylase domain-containing protein [Haloglomus sp.]
MSADRRAEIRRRLDEDLSIASFESGPRPTEEAAALFFRDLFVQLLEFDASGPETGGATWRELPAERWPDETRVTAARLFAEAGEFRVVYVELEALTRTAERNAVQQLARSDWSGDWAVEGTVLAVFHAPGAETWHLVTPYEDAADGVTTGRPVLRRYTLGAGQTHRTAAGALRELDASRDGLAERIDEAFSVESVTEAFYEDYKRTFDTLSDELQEKGLDAEGAERYAHLTLNRLLFVYYLQETGWIGERTEFVRWFYERYEAAGDAGAFHETWLSALFFEGMNQPVGEPIAADLPADVEDAVAGVARVNGGLFERTELDRNGVFLSDDALGSVVRDFLEEYNFTVTEESPYDVDVAVDPAMLGRIYESLIAEQERGEAGIFYTPRVEVDVMCRLALYEQFCDRIGDLEGTDRRRIVEFVFGEPRDWDPEAVDETDTLEAILHDLRIVDPACGSGAFLVGMQQVLTELYRKLGSRPDYGHKKQIVGENLYGVDSKDWAVQVAEFRLWLSLAESAGERPSRRPVLPDLSFELKSGDSLVRPLDAGDRSGFGDLPTDAADAADQKVAALERAKKQFFEGEIDSAGLKLRQTAILRSSIEDRTESPGREATTESEQGEERAAEPAAATGAEGRIDSPERLRDRLASGERADFVWELDFPAAMLDGGFDIVIGNPPYVRQEAIVDQNVDSERLERLSDDEVRALRSDYKEALRSFADERFDIEPHRTSDLYLYFFFRSLDLLRDGGTLSFVTPNSWLDVDYGVPLQELLLTEGNLEYVLENRTQRTFEAADVNTVISIVNRDASGQLSSGPEFVAANESDDRLVSVETVESILAGETARAESCSYRGQELRVRTEGRWRSIGLSAAALWELGGGTTSTTDGAGSVRRPRGRYRSGKWGKFIRAPTVFFEMVGDADRELSPLGRECQVNRGTRTGANQFFYLPSKYYSARPDGESLVLESTGEWPDGTYRSELTIPREYWMHETEDGWKPNLVLKTSKSFETTIFDVDSLEPGSGVRYLLVIDDPRAALDGDIEAYVEWGGTYDPGRDDLGRKTSPFPSSVSNRGVDWYDLSADLQRGDVLPMKNVDTRHAYWFPEQRAWIDDRLHGIEVPGDEEERRFLAGVLNSTYGALSCEVNGRVNLGQGALDIATDDHRRTLIPVLDEVEAGLKSDIATAFEEFGRQSATSIFDELGASEPEAFTLGAVAEDRFELDRLVIRELLGFDEATHREVCEGVLTLVRQRINKADSV